MAKVNGKQVDDALLERIQKLLRLANDDGASEGEVENAMMFARKLMREYGLEMADIILNESVEENVDRVVENEALCRGGILRMDGLLLNVCVVLCDVGVFYRSVSRKGKIQQTVIFYGLEMDCAIAKTVFNELRLSMRTLARFRLGKKWSPKHTAYCKGFALCLQTRAKTIRAEEGKQHADEISTALIIRKEDMLAEYAERLHLVRSRRSSFQIGNPSAANLGAEDANNVDLDTTKYRSRKFLPTKGDEF